MTFRCADCRWAFDLEDLAPGLGSDDPPLCIPCAEFRDETNEIAQREGFE